MKWWNNRHLKMDFAAGDDLEKILNKHSWRELGETFGQQWDTKQTKKNFLAVYYAVEA